MKSRIAVAKVPSKQAAGEREFFSKAVGSSTSDRDHGSAATRCAARWSFSEIPLFPIQPKLEIGFSDDPLEQEADLVAERVMRIGEPRCGTPDAFCNAV